MGRKKTVAPVQYDPLAGVFITMLIRAIHQQ
jgi:hypothetical protein